MTSPLWRHRVTRRHRDHVRTIAHRHFPIGCPLEPSRYIWLFHFPRYLARKLWQRLLRDDVINNVIRPGSTKTIYIPYRKHWRRRSILHKHHHDVTIMTSQGHATSTSAWPADSPWAIHTGTIIIFVKLTINILLAWAYIGDGWGVVGSMWPQKSGKNMFFWQLSGKFRAFC